MSRKARVNIAEVTLRWRVPKGVAARDAKNLIRDHYTGAVTIYPDAYEEERFGRATIKPKPVQARIIRPNAPPPKERPQALLSARFFDAHGTEVETISGPADVVLSAASRFMLLHGTDPDEDGKDAAPGSITFHPGLA